jgi:hypothetical protein
VDDGTPRALWLAYHGLIFLTLAGLMAALPVLLAGGRPNRAPRRFVIGAITGYLLAVVCLGFYAYSFVPRQYTRELDFSDLPHTGSLAEHRTYWYARTETWDPEWKERVRAERDAERTDFVRGWALGGAVGFAVGGGGLFLYYRRRPHPVPLPEGEGAKARP